MTEEGDEKVLKKRNPGFAARLFGPPSVGENHPTYSFSGSPEGLTAKTSGVDSAHADDKESPDPETAEGHPSPARKRYVGRISLAFAISGVVVLAAGIIWMLVDTELAVSAATILGPSIALIAIAAGLWVTQPHETSPANNKTETSGRSHKLRSPRTWLKRRLTDRSTWISVLAALTLVLFIASRFQIDVPEIDALRSRCEIPASPDDLQIGPFMMRSGVASVNGHQAAAAVAVNATRAQMCLLERTWLLGRRGSIVQLPPDESSAVRIRSGDTYFIAGLFPGTGPDGAAIYGEGISDYRSVRTGDAFLIAFSWDPTDITTKVELVVDVKDPRDPLEQRLTSKYSQADFLSIEKYT